MLMSEQMPNIARIGDLCTGTCFHPSHVVPISMTGTIQTGASTVTCEGSGVARIGDQVLTDCGHIGLIVSSSTTVFAEGAMVARVGVSVAGDFVATITAGASTGSAN